MPSSCSEEAVEHLEIYRANATTLMCLGYHNFVFHVGKQACMVHRTCICFLCHVSVICVGHLILVRIRPFIRLGASEPGT